MDNFLIKSTKHVTLRNTFCLKCIYNIFILIDSCFKKKKDLYYNIYLGQ